MWNIINENINEKPLRNDTIFININGTITHNSQVTAETFNTYFSTVAQHIHTENSENLHSVVNENNPLNFLCDVFKQLIQSIKLKFVSTKEIEDVISSLKMKDSHGYNGISTKVLKQIIPYILTPLTYIFNLMISTGIFPTRMKFVEIKPPCKRGEMANIFNFRHFSC